MVYEEVLESFGGIFNVNLGIFRGFLSFFWEKVGKI